MKFEETSKYIDGIRKPSQAKRVKVMVQDGNTPKDKDMYSTAIAQNSALLSNRIVRNRIQKSKEAGRTNHVAVTSTETSQPRQSSLFDYKLPVLSNAWKIALLAAGVILLTVVLVVVIFNLTH